MAGGVRQSIFGEPGPPGPWVSFSRPLTVLAGRVRLEPPETLPHPDEVAAQIVPMCLGDFTDNGAVYKFDPKGLFKQF